MKTSLVALMALTSSMLACGAPEAPQSTTAELSRAAEVTPDAPRGRVGSHGMVLVGDPSAAFLSHIPMFRSNAHDVQLIVRGSFPETALPKTFSDQLFTFLPERFSLDALRLGALTELSGTLFVGNFESGGRPIAAARFMVASVIHQHVLVADDVDDPKAYLLFGTRGRVFAAHKVGGAPSFDEVLRVTFSDLGPSDGELAQGLDVTFDGSTATTSGQAYETATTSLSCLVGPDFVPSCER